VLFAQCQRVIDQWTENSIRFFERLRDDWAAIQRELCIDAGDRVVRMHGSGDSHAQGQSVFIVECRSGARFVYKPRDIQIEERFQGLLVRLNGLGFQPQFKTIKTIVRSGYGWVEFVAAQPCQNENEVENFYLRKGGLLGVLYALGATDFHFENIIASGHNPVAIDLEALFHPNVFVTLGNGAGVDDAIVAKISDSVISVGMLPRPSFNAKQPFDISAVGSKAGQVTPFKQAVVKNTQTDEIAIDYRSSVTPQNQSRPTLRSGVPVEVNGIALLQGFERIYDLVCLHKNEFLRDGGILEQFRDSEIRVILRPTMAYTTLLRNSFHPNLLRDIKKYEAHLTKLAWPDCRDSSVARQICDEEQRQLRNGDVPIFRCLASRSRVPILVDQSGFIYDRWRSSPP
jgi:type 2 lantibiotic biosynthesis protein LanM